MKLKDLLSVIEIDTPIQIEDWQEMHCYRFDMTIEIPQEYHERTVDSIIPHDNRLSVLIF